MIRLIAASSLTEGRIYQLPTGTLVAAHSPNTVAGSVPSIDLVDRYQWTHRPSRHVTPLRVSHNGVIRDGSRALKTDAGDLVTIDDLYDTGDDATLTWGPRRTR